MAAHLIIIACLVAEPHTCSEIPVPEVTSEDVVSCNSTSREKSEKWQAEHKDQYLVIATKCVKAESDDAATGDAAKGNDAGKPDDSGKADAPQQ
jgi:hypothetical protein